MLNPFTATDLAVRLVSFLREDDLKRVAEYGELSDRVREAAQLRRERVVRERGVSSS